METFKAFRSQKSFRNLSKLSKRVFDESFGFCLRILFVSVEEPRTLWVLVKGGLSPVKIKNAEKLDDVSDLLQKLKERSI